MMDNETFDEVLNGFKEVDSIVKRLKTRIAELEEENEKQNEKVRFLEECLDRKEKLNVGYRKENKKLREELSAYDREYFDEDKKAKNIFKEDRDLGGI